MPGCRTSARSWSAVSRSPPSCHVVHKKVKTMLEYYPAKYFDKFGEENTTIQNNGKELKMVVRGLEFTDTSFDSWEPTDKDNPELLNLFLIHPMFNTLYQYRLEFEIQIP